MIVVALKGKKKFITNAVAGFSENVVPGVWKNMYVCKHSRAPMLLPA
jgi:hypothetical protein